MNTINHTRIKPVFALIFVALFALTSGASIAFAADPTLDPPLGNTNPPINDSSTSQVKSGGISLGSLIVTGGSIFSSTVQLDGVTTVNERVNFATDVGNSAEIAFTGTGDANINNNTGADFYIRNTVATGNLRFGTSATDRLTINASGSVGIGDDTPDVTLKLDVNGQIGATEYCDENGANCTAAAAIGTVDQTLSFATSSLTISGTGGNSVDLSSLGSDNLGDHTATEALDMSTFDMTGIGEIQFNESANHKIHTSVHGLIFDGGDGSNDFAIYDNYVYSDVLILGYGGIAEITTLNTNENLLIDPEGTGNINITGDTNLTGDFDVTGTGSFTGVVSGVTPTAAAHLATKAYVDGEVAAGGSDDQTIDTFSIASNILSLSLEDDGEANQTVSLAPYLDNTDAQDLSLTGTTLSLTGDATTVDLSALAADNLGNHIATQGLDMDTFNMTDVAEIQFESGSNHSISSGVHGLVFDGGDGTNDFLVYDDFVYSDVLILGYSGLAEITTQGTNENLLIDPEGTGNINITGDTNLTGDFDVTGTGSFTGVVSGVTPTAAAHLATKAYVDGEVAAGGSDDQTIDTFSIASNILSLSLEDDGEANQTVSLAPYLDNTDAQDLSLTGTTLSLTGDATTVDLSALAADNLGNHIATQDILATSGSAASPSYTFNADQDSGIYNAVANQVNITTAGVLRGTFSSSGLTLPGRVYAANGTAALPAYVFGTDTDTGIYRASANTVGISTAGGLRTTINNSGMSVTGTGVFTGTVTGATPTAATHLTTKAYVDGLSGGGADNLGDHTATQALDMSTFNVTDVAEIQFESGSNHSISSGVHGLVFDGGDGNNDFLVYDNSVYSDVLVLGYTGAAQIITQGSNENLAINPNGTGNINITGDTNLTGDFDVTGTGSFTGVVSGVTPTAAAHLATKAYVDGASGGGLWTDGGSTTYLDGDNIAIGATSASYELDVDGDISADAFIYSSDRRLKTGFSSFADRARAILGLGTYQYTWKDSGEDDFGVIAQEVEKVFPELVVTGTDGFKAVDYAGLVAPLLEVTKQQQAEIDELRARLEALEN